MKKALVFIIAVILALSFLVMGRNLAVKAVLKKAVYAVTGLNMSIESVEVGILKGCIRVRNLILFNPEGFPDNIMFEIPLLYIDCDLGSLFTKKCRITEMDFYLKELNVIRNRQGILNLEYLNIVKGAKSKESGAGGESRVIPVRIDKLHLKIGKVFYKDYRDSASAKITEFEVNLDEGYENIENPYALGALIVAEALNKTAISRMTGFDLRLLDGQLNGIISTGSEAMGKAAERLKGVSTELTKKTTKTFAEAKKAVEDFFGTLPLESGKEN